MNDKIEQAIDLISDMTIAEFATLANAIREKFDLHSTISIGVSPDQIVQSNSNYVDVHLVDYYRNKKIPAIKEVRSLMDLGLKEAKDFVDNIGYGPTLLKARVLRPEAESIVRRFEGIGKIELRDCRS